ncbi:uncharacterized protein [Fopius arisanus]|uniref:Uncharacterized protein n=1 Tax=Fopius arisanus TaxID=64838 RepID=A0A9R1U1L9_9HYME|nr:PREDICTED: uncharacterized protein LOC105267578 [Fopius arisanus]
MFKLVVLFATVAFATARPGLLSSPVWSTIVGEKTIESHGNSIVHNSAPVVHTYEAAPVILPAASVLAEKTISSHGHSIVHKATPIVETHQVAPVVLASQPLLLQKTVHHEPLVFAQPIVAEKTISSHGHSIVHEAPLLAHSTHWW